FKLKNELRLSHKLEQPHLMKEARRNRARVLTALRAKGATLSGTLN
ncbi:MAG: 50S ribosomal protein L29, partial [Chlamydiae bacterium]|nr:50S ribosomal protein L29 [Chlamydiota bacterium]